MSKKVAILLALLAPATAAGTTGCNQLVAQATGGHVISRANLKVLNDSGRKICAVKVTGPDGSVISDNALSGGPIGIEPGKEGFAQVDERLQKVTLEAYSCDPQKLMLAKQDVDMAAPQPMRVH